MQAENNSIKQAIFNSKYTYLIAELSANHGGKISIAKDTIKSMAENGTDAVKVQTYTADSLSMNVDNEFLGPLKSGLWKGTRPYDLFEQAAMPWDWQPELKEYAESLGLDFFSSPFDYKAVDFLADIEVSAYKIASFDITDIPLIRYIAQKQKPIIISTGVASFEDVELAYQTCVKAGNQQIALLKCTSAYPSPYEDVNLRTIPYLAEKFKAPIGLSDHTLGIEVPIAAVTLGARIIEKHYILDRAIGGADAAFSLTPNEFGAMAKAIRNIEKALGKFDYIQTDLMKDARTRARSYFYIKDLRAGEKISADCIKSVRPAAGLPPKDYDRFVNSVLRRDVKKGTPASWEDHGIIKASSFNN
jgi:pseudaminic acid synthase